MNIEFTSKSTSNVTPIVMHKDKIIGVRITPIYSYPEGNDEAFFFDSQDKYLEGYKLQIVEESLQGDDYQNYISKTEDILKSLKKIGVTKGNLSINLPRVKNFNVLNTEIIPTGTEEFLEIDTLQRMGLNNAIHFVVHKGPNGKYISDILLGNLYLEPRSQCLYNDGNKERFITEPIYLNHISNCVNMIELWLADSGSFDSNYKFTHSLLAESLH